MPQLKSKRGCATCVTRKKKCDETWPVCGDCLRFGFKCTKRPPRDTSSSPIRQLGYVRRRDSGGQAPRRAISNGYPSFGNDFERSVAANSAGIFKALLARFADSQYREMTILGTLCTQDVMVREAITAYSIITFGQLDNATYAACIQAYQSCTARLRRAWSRGPQQDECTLVTTFFLGFLEALRLGSTTNALAHLRTCRSIMVSRLKQERTSQQSPSLLSLYRILAECLIFNIAVQSQFEDSTDLDEGDWDDFFETLLPANEHSRLSPFLGGFLDLYRLMFLASQASRKLKNNQLGGQEASKDILQTCHVIRDRLSLIETALTKAFGKPVLDHDPHPRVETRFSLTMIALKIQLHKLTNPDAMASDDVVTRLVSRAMHYVQSKDICEPGYHAIRWPLTVLACAANRREDFEELLEAMVQSAPKMDGAGHGKMVFTYTLLRHFRHVRCEKITCNDHDFCARRGLQDSLDLLFSLSVFDEARCTI